jgi:RNA polymerase sigma-54 factor
MQKLVQNQILTQKLSPQQIQFIKLLQIPTAELQARIEEELENNPALEDNREVDYDREREKEKEKETPEDDFGNDFDMQYEEDTYNDDFEDDFNDDDFDREKVEEISIEEYLGNENDNNYQYQDNNYREEEKEMPIVMQSTLNDSLMMQLGYLKLSPIDEAIGTQIIGSLDNDGYLRRPIAAIVNDLAFSQNIETDEERVEQILKEIQLFEPAGIAARDLKECLILQLERKTAENALANLAIKLLKECFEEFTKKHYDKIAKKLDFEDDELKEVIQLILKLNPKPGENSTSFTGTTQYLIPDFILKNDNNKLEIILNSKNAPELRVNAAYADMLDMYSKSNKKDKHARETISFVKQKLDAAKWFIDAIKQRQQTLLKTMNAIVEYQYEFFLDGDESKFKPMILKDIADKIGMDISTISRVANSKSIQTDFGIFPLKYFFSEGISTDTGEDVSSREVKFVLKEMVDNENKRKPLSDDKLEKMLKAKGYQIARRTVAKYREQLNIPVARLRKKL